MPSISVVKTASETASAVVKSPLLQMGHASMLSTEENVQRGPPYEVLIASSGDVVVLGGVTSSNSQVGVGNGEAEGP